MQLLTASVIALAAAVSESAAATEMTTDEKILWFLIFAAVVVVFILVSVILIRRKIEETRSDEAMTEVQFERQMLEFMERGSGAGIVRPEPSLAGLPPASAAQAPESLEPSATPAMPSDPLAPILDQLRSAGLYETSEGSVPLGDGFMRAQRVRLRGGRTALILPYLETDLVLSRQIKPHDYLIIRLHSGEVLVARKWGDFITDSIKF